LVGLLMKVLHRHQRSKLACFRSVVLAYTGLVKKLSLDLGQASFFFDHHYLSYQLPSL